MRSINIYTLLAAKAAAEVANPRMEHETNENLNRRGGRNNLTEITRCKQMMICIKMQPQF